MASKPDLFWDDCPLVERVEGLRSGAPVLKGTRIPADTLVENVESIMELDGVTEDQAIKITLQNFPSTPGGEVTLRSLIAYQETHLHNFQP